RIGGIRCCRTFVPYVPQERPDHYERRQVGVGLDRQTHLGAGRPIKHPRWNLQPTVRVGCSQVAAKDNTARPLNCLMNADPQAGPWMPRIQQLPKLGIVGVLKPCCTTRSDLIVRSATNPDRANRSVRNTRHALTETFWKTPA